MDASSNYVRQQLTSYPKTTTSFDKRSASNAASSAVSRATFFDFGSNSLGNFIIASGALGDGNRVQLQYSRCAWAGGTYFPVVLLCQFFGFWREIGFGVTYLRISRVQFSCGVVLVFWF
jgi:hypothetical protein